MTDGLGGWSGAEFVLAADRLDTPDVVEAADPGDVLRQVASSAAQVRTALRSCAEADLSALTPDARPRAIVVAGLGASGVAGEMLNAMTGPGSPVQVVTSPAGRLPGWVGAADAVVAVSYSGTTPETLAVATEAARRGCPLAAVSTAGSPLHRIAEQVRGPFVPVVPPGPTGLPRSMLWALAIPLLVMAERLGVTRIGADIYELAASRLEEVSHQCRPASESFVNPGKSLALDLAGALPMVWGTSLLSGVAAQRFASQLSENAKYPALAGMLPEAAHSQVAAFDGPFAPGSGRPAPRRDDPLAAPDDLSGWDLDYEEPEPAGGFAPLRLVLIADPGEDQRVGAQRAAVTELAAQRGLGLSELAMDGEHPLVRLAGVIQLTDYASVYLAIASGIDPGQARAIEDLQARIELRGMRVNWRDMRAVLAAFLANLGIAVTKFVAFLLTGSASMLAESVHSVADTGNEVLLMIGRGRASRPPSEEHPFGFGRERYFYGFVVSVMLFTVGAAFSVYDGIHKIIHPASVEAPAVAFIVLGASAVMEGFSLRTGIHEANRVRGGRGWGTFIRRTKAPELPVVLLEDTAAMIGLAFAFAGVGLTVLTGNGRWDGAGSLAIGLLLAAAAAILAVEMKSLLIGEAASADMQQKIIAALEDGPQPVRVIHMRTVHISPDSLLVTAKFAARPTDTAAQIAAAVNAAEKRARAAVPIALTIYLEPDIYHPSMADQADPSIRTVLRGRPAHPADPENITNPADLANPAESGPEPPGQSHPPA